MAKYRIYDEGNAFFDDYGINSNDVGGVRINGSCVERLGKGNQWFTAYNAGKPIDRLLWTENGAIHAVTDDGKVVNANVNLARNPNCPTKIREITIDEASKSSSKKVEEKKKSSGSSGFGWSI